MSRLRARCPDCRTLTAVAVGPEYQCHSCGREFLAGLVRVPRAWGDGGETMAEAAHLRAALSRGERDRGGHARGAEPPARLRAARPPDRARRLLLLARRRDRGALRRRGVPRRRLARRARRPEHAADLAVRERVGDAAADGDRRRRRARRSNVALVGARNLDPPEVEFIESAGVQTGDGAIERALEGADAVYVALDCDSFDPGELAVFMPEPDGLRLGEVEELLARSRVAEPRSPGSASRASSATTPTSRSSRGSQPRSASSATAATRRPGSKIARCPKRPRIDVSIEHKQAPEPPPAKKHPNTCPQCGSHYRDDELVANLRVCTQCGHHFPVRARERIDAAGGQGQLRRGGSRPALGRPARASSTCAPTTSGSPRRRSRPGSATRSSSAPRRSRICPASWR